MGLRLLTSSYNGFARRKDARLVNSMLEKSWGVTKESAFFWVWFRLFV